MDVLQPAVDALNHLLRQNAWASVQLSAYAGKTVKLALVPIELCVMIEAHGEFSIAPLESVPDASIALTPFAAFDMLAGNQQGNANVALGGDTELAAAIGQVLQRLQWEYEEDLSHLIGDVPAHQLVSFGKQMVAEGQRQLSSLAGMFTEYWLEERPLIAKRRDLDRFATSVDALRNDADRLAKRLERLAKGA